MYVTFEMEMESETGDGHCPDRIMLAKFSELIFSSTG